MTCGICQNAEADDRLSPDCLICSDCWVDLAHKKRRRSLLALGCIWVITLAYALVVLFSGATSDVWTFAAIAPAVLIALFLSAFSYQGLVNTVQIKKQKITNSLLHNTQDLLKT